MFDDQIEKKDTGKSWFLLIIVDKIFLEFFNFEKKFFAFFSKFYANFLYF